MSHAYFHAVDLMQNQNVATLVVSVRIQKIKRPIRLYNFVFFVEVIVQKLG
jgi:hypothetical protein